MVHVPALTKVTVEPLTWHTGVVSDAKLTGNPDDAVAVTENGEVPNVRVASAPKVMVWPWSALVTVKLWLTLGAAL